MADLKTKYMGLSLKSPLIVSSSGLTNTAEKIRKIEEYGAGAVVLKSLFEEQISHEAGHYLENSIDGFPEAVDYVMNYVRNNSVDDYLTLIEESVKSVKIPVIASINCVNPGEWIDFARKIQDAGASAIELNINIIPVSAEMPSAQLENKYFSIVEQVKKKLSIPVSVKVGYHFTNLLYMIKQMIIREVNSVTLFNRFYEPDINPEDGRT
ncbi:MAG: diguanylate cyclase, partial [Bacteroidota bacterium]